MTEKFKENWNKNVALFGQTDWEQEADFCYYIETPLPLKIAQRLFELGQKFKTDLALKKGQWISPENLCLTVTLPGRLGTHFQKNDIAFMKKTLESLTTQTPQFELIIQNFNVFPNTLWAEIYDHSGRLQQLHETLCTEIPFSQHPEFRYANYLPHISLAYGIQVAQPLKVDTARNFEPMNFTFNTLQLGKAKWQGSELSKIKSAEYTLKNE